MEIFSKNFSDITQEDIEELTSNPINFENFQIEYKIEYDGDANELRRDIVQFTSGFETGYLIYGIEDEPRRIAGIESSGVDTLKLVLNVVLSKKISPLLNPLPTYKPVPLSDGKYIFIIKIEPKPYGLYGIRKKENMSNQRDYKTFQFYKRLDGSKHQMDIEEVVELIEEKARLRNLPEISTEVGLKDERIELLELVIQNLTLNYYKGGVTNNRYESSISDKIFDFISILDRLKPHYLERFAPNGGVYHSRIISTYFDHLSVQQFKEKIVTEEIIPRNLTRSIFIYAGDLAYVIYENFKHNYKCKNILIDDIRKKYQHVIQANELESLREEYSQEIFNKALSILEDYGIIRTTGDYTGSDCKHVYEILSLSRLQKFREKFSLAYIQ